MLATIIVYLLLVLIIGNISKRYSTKSEAGFYLGDRKFGPFTSAISAGATDSSGWQFIGAAGFAYTFGISAMWMLPGLVMGYLFNWVFIAPRLNKYAIENNVQNLSDYWEKRFEDKSRLLKRTSGVIISVFFIAYMASQLSAAGITFNAILDLGYGTSIILSVSFVLAYTVLGGYTSIIWTDFIQGIVMLGTLLVVPIAMILSMGGFVDFFQTVKDIDPILTSYTGGEVGAAAFGMIIGLLGIGLAYPGQPQLLQRFVTAKDGRAIHNGTYVSMVWVLVVVTGSNLIGLIGRVVMPGLENPEYVFPNMAMSLFPPVIGGIIVAAIFAAIQSTYSSQMMVATQSVASDIIKTTTKKAYSENQNVIIARVVMIALSVLATSIALFELESVFSLTLYAFAGLASSFGPLMVLSFTKKNITTQGAFSGMVIGTATIVVWKLTPYSVYLYEIIPGMIASTVAILIVSKMTSKKSVNYLKESV